MNAALAAFRELHRSGCFVMPNPWDVGSAVFLHRLGFPALATTSAGMAFARGLPDAVGAVTRDVVLQHAREIVAATPLPVNADYQHGYADDPEALAESVTLCVRTGVAGLSIEDATGRAEQPLYDRDLAVERIRAARRAIDATGIPVVLTARCEAYLIRHPDPARTAIDRLVAFAEAGADCLFAPGVRDLETIGSMVKSIAPLPLNVLVASPGLDVKPLAELGVRRISMGSSLARVAWGAFMRAAKTLAETRSFDGLRDAATFAELEALFRERRA